LEDLGPERSPLGPLKNPGFPKFRRFLKGGKGLGSKNSIFPWPEGFYHFWDLWNGNFIKGSKEEEFSGLA